MKSLSSKTYQCGVTIQGLTTLSGTVYLTGITNTASWDHVIVGTTAQGQIYTRTYAQFMGDVATGISLSSYVTGSGTTNYLPKFTGTSALGNSQIFDNGTNVGIGTASPNVTLEANGIIRSDRVGVASQYVQINGGDAAGPFITAAGAAKVLTIQNNSTTSSDIYFDQAVASTYQFKQASVTKMILDASGNVGIGTANPSYKLDVNGSFNAVTSGVSLTYNSGILYHGNYYQFTSGNNYLLFARTSGDLILGSNDTERLRITSAGNVGIGTTSPNTKLHVSAGNFLISGTAIGGGADANSGLRIVAPISTTHYNWMLGAQQNINSAFEITPSTTVGGTTFSTPTAVFLQNGNVGVGTTSPATLLDVNGVITATGGNSTNWNTAYGWGNHASANYVPQARTLTINGTSYDLSANRSWTITTATPGGSDTQFQYNSSGTLAGASALTYNSATNRVGINQASPGYDLDVNGQVRVQDKLRVGTVNSGNGVVHMSSTATINPSATTIVWSQNVSVGMCAFIEYYIINNNTGTDQRAGKIIVTWNQSGTPTIAHTETTTPDIGSTVTVNFTSSLVGSDARINAVNSSANPYTMVMSYKYF